MSFLYINVYTLLFIHSSSFININYLSHCLLSCPWQVSIIQYVKSCLLIFKFIPVCFTVTLQLPNHGADWKFFESASVVLSLYKEMFAFVFKNIPALLLHSCCICTKDISFAYFMCQSNWSHSGSCDNFGISILCLNLWNLISYIHESLVLLATRSTAWICGRLPAEIAVLNPAGCTDVCLLWVLCVVI
jgi:hypothetical protein